MRCQVGVGVIDGQLRAGHDEEPVLLACPLGLALDRRDVLPEPVGRHAQVRPRVVGRVHVVGDAEDVKPVRAVEVDEGGEREAPVAPRRLRVELGQE